MSNIRICPICKKAMRDHADNQMVRCRDEKDRRDKTYSLVYKAHMSGLVPLDIQDYTFASSEAHVGEGNMESFDKAKQWVSGDTTTLFLYGSVGTGKTHIARCCLLESCEYGKSIAEVKATMLCNIGNLFKSGELMEKYKYIHVLLIDDIDKANWNKKGLELLWELMDWRYDRGYRTIFTSNVSPQSFKEIFNKATEGNTSKISSLMDRMRPLTQARIAGESKRRA